MFASARRHGWDSYEEKNLVDAASGATIRTAGAASLDDLSDALSEKYLGLSRISDSKVARIEEDFGSIDHFIERKMSRRNPELDDIGAEFLKIMRRYQQEGTVFQSPIKGARYRVSSADDTHCVVQRLDANESEQCTAQRYANAVKRVREADGRILI